MPLLTTSKPTLRSKASADGEQKTWGIRAGKRSEAHELFLKDGVIALADARLGDLRSLGSERIEFYKRFAATHPEKPKVAVRGIGGKFYRFANEMQVGDRVLYPSFYDKQIYFGEVIAEYSFQRSNVAFPHQRCVRWHGSLPKNEFSEGTIRELGAARTLFRFKTHLQEIEKGERKLKNLR